MTDQPLTDIPLPETLEGCLTLLEEACFPKRPPLPPEASEFEEISDPEKLCKNPLVSVTISTYKHEAWLDEALRGVLMQETDFPFEVIVADDASPDRTAEIALEWQRRHPDKVRVLRGKCNSYGIENHKRLKAACRAPWRALLEGDDYWTDPRKLQKQMDILRETGAVMCVAFTETRKDGRSLRCMDCPPTRFISARTFAKRYLHTSTYLYSRAALQAALAHNSTYQNLYDIETFYFLSTQGRVALLPEVVSVYRITGKGIATQLDTANRERFFFWQLLRLYLHGPRRLRGLFLEEVLKHVRFIPKQALGQEPSMLRLAWQVARMAWRQGPWTYRAWRSWRKAKRLLGQTATP